MKLALPTAQGKLCSHFGHCETFTIVDIDEKANLVIGHESKIPPPHEPGVLPCWLYELGVERIIAGGMGQRAQQLFEEKGIGTLVGVESKAIEEIISDYLTDSLTKGRNACDH